MYDIAWTGILLFTISNKSVVWFLKLISCVQENKKINLKKIELKQNYRMNKKEYLDW